MLVVGRGGTPYPVMVGGTLGTPHHPDLAGGYPRYPPPLRPGRSTPPTPSRCGLTNKLKTVPSPFLRMRAVKRWLPKMDTHIKFFLPHRAYVVADPGFPRLKAYSQRVIARAGAASPVASLGFFAASYVASG